MKNKIEDLRNHLFATIESLMDEDRPMDIERAKAIAEVGKVIVDSAKEENNYLKLSRKTESEFLKPSKFIDEELPKQIDNKEPIVRPGSNYSNKSFT